jgi:hypothetical protein
MQGISSKIIWLKINNSIFSEKEKTIKELLLMIRSYKIVKFMNIITKIAFLKKAY